MKRLFLILTLASFVLTLSGQNLLNLSGNAIEVTGVTGVDHVFVFEDLTSAEIKTAETATWYKYQNADSTLFQSGIDYLYPEHNTGYIVHVGSERTSFWVIDYSQCRLSLNTLSVDLSDDDRCQSTPLLLVATVPQMSYQTLDGRQRTLNRQCYVSYSSLGWDGEQWNDSLCVDTLTISNHLKVGAPLKNTSFTLHADQYADLLGIDADSISTALYDAIAVDAHPTTQTTTRGTEEENKRSNEVDRPTEETQLSGSAPLEILFKANGNAPVAQYYQWRIYKGSEMIVQRTDQEHRYVFEDYGEYRVVCVVSNDYCQADSTEINVSVSLSQLLVPNVFTPNGDGHNDEFRVSYRSILEFECWIYNRWGKLVYHWTDPAKGWDGTINGRPAAVGAYYYVIRAKGADAEKGAKYHKATTKRPASVGVYQLSGDINLIR